MPKQVNLQDLYDRIELLERQLGIAEADVRFWRGEVDDRDNEIARLDRAFDNPGVYEDEVD